MKKTGSRLLAVIMALVMLTGVMAPAMTASAAVGVYLPDGMTFTLAVNISSEPVSFALPGGKAVSLRPHGFHLGE